MTEPFITEPGRYDLDEATYHADPVIGGSLSSTGARTLITATPARFAYDREHGRADNPVFELGRAAHAVVLGTGAPIVEVHADDWRTKAAKEAADQARADGSTPLLTRDVERVHGMAEALRAHPVAGPLLARPGVAEQSFVGRCPETGVMCRVRIDWLPDVEPGARALAVDYKSTADASPAGFAASMARYGYHQQGPFYGDVLQWLGLADEVQFVLVAQEKEPPYLVTVGWPDAEATAWGRVLNRKARDLYATCTATGHWPGYPTEPVEFALPGWQARQYETADDAGTYRTAADLIGDPA